MQRQMKVIWTVTQLSAHSVVPLSKITGKPASFELSSYIHMYHAFANPIYSLSLRTTCVFLVWQTFVFCFYVNNFGHYTCMCIMPMKFSADILKYFTFVSNISPFTSMIPVAFLVWHMLLPLKIPIQFLLKFINIFHLPAIFVLLHLTTYVFLVWQTYFLLHIYGNIFEFVHTWVYIQKPNIHEVLCWQPQIYYICKPIFFLHIYDPISIPSLAVISVFVNAYEVFTSIHKHSHLAAIFVLHLM